MSRSNPFAVSVTLYLRCAAACLFLLSFADPARAECAQPGVFAIGPSTYYGQLADGRRFGATLDFEGPSGEFVQGRLFVGPDFRDVVVKGQVEERRTLRLTSTETGQPIFEGKFLDTYLDRKHLGCDVVSGKLGGVAATLALSHVSADQTQTGPGPARVNAAALAVHDAVLAGNANELAEHLHYPVAVTFQDKSAKPLTIANRTDFLRVYPRLIEPKLKEAMVAEVPHDLFCRETGCMMAAGRVWFDGHDNGKIMSFSAGW